MADSRQTKIVSYKLQGNTTDLMHELQAAISSLDVLDQKLTKIASEARVIGGKDKTSLARASAISTAETQIEKLRSSLDPRKIEVVSPDQLNLIKQMNVEILKIFQDLGRFKSATTVSQKALDRTTTSLRSFNTKLRNANLTIDNTTKKLNTLYRTLRSVYSKFTLIRLLVSYFLDLYDVTAEYVETMNLFNVATKGSRDSLNGLAEAMADAYNTDIGPIKNSIAIFRQYANTMGFVVEQANILSDGLTKITYDLASLYNTTYTDMTKAVKSGLAGQTKSLMQYGISVHKATLEQYALNLGLEKSWSAFTETEKVALRYIAILDQASLAQGDLARTIESPSNQLKIAKAQVQIFIRNLGALVTLVSQHVLPVFNGLMIAVNAFMEVMAKAAGYEIPDYSDNLSATNEMFDDGTESVEEYEDAVNGLLAPLDEINQASNGKDKGILGTIDPKILAALESYDNLMSQISTKTDILAEAFGNLLEPQLFEGVGSVLGVAFTAFGQGVDIVTGALTTLSPVLSVVLNLLGLLLEGTGWLLGNVVSPVLTFIGVLTSNIWLLVAAFAALNLAQVAVTGNWKAMTAVKMAQWFASLTTKIYANTVAALANVAASAKAKLASMALAVALWWETAAWWQKAIAVIASAGALALVVSGIVMAATATTKAQADRTMGSARMPAMAKGGVVSAPTVALIGEGRYKEAVVPLGNSPQFKTMKDDIANEVLRKINPSPNGRGGQPSRGATPVILNINGREIARAILPDLGYAQPQTGVKLTR